MHSKIVFSVIRVEVCANSAFTSASLPLKQKEMIADEIQRAKESSCSKGKPVEKLAAKGICCKYLDRRAGHLCEEAAVDFALAVCLCLRKKNSSIGQVTFDIHNRGLSLLGGKVEATLFAPEALLRVLAQASVQEGYRGYSALMESVVTNRCLK